VRCRVALFSLIRVALFYDILICYYVLALNGVV